MNIKDNSFLISQAVHKDHAAPHIFEEYSGQDQYNYAKNAGSVPLGLGIAGRYQAVFANLSDGQMGLVRVTQDGKLMVDASITVGSLTVAVTPTRWTKRFFAEVDVTNADSTVTFLDVSTGLPFAADEVTVANDDIAVAIWLDYNGAAVADASHDKVLAGEKFTDKVPSGNIHLITNVAGPIKARIWARAL